MLDPTEFGKAMAGIVREATGPLLKRIELLESRQPERGEKGEPGVPGTQGAAGLDAPPVNLTAVAVEVLGSADLKAFVTNEIGSAVAKHFMANPVENGKDGVNGVDGKDGAAGLDGQKGADGPAGRPGPDADPIDIKDVVAEILAGTEIKTLVDLHVAEAVPKYFEASPVRHGKDGRDGKDGERGLPGERGIQGEKGVDGSDGLGQAGAMIDRDGCLIITTTKGEAIKLGGVVGKDGTPGKDGADFSEATLDYDGERSLIIRSKGVEIVKRLPIPMDKGYWREAMACEKGDIVTHVGNAWIALRDTKAKPCLENKDDWRLFARKGKDGTDGKAGRDLGPSPPIKLDGGNA